MEHFYFNSNFKIEELPGSALLHEFNFHNSLREEGREKVHNKFIGKGMVTVV